MRIFKSKLALSACNLQVGVIIGVEDHLWLLLSMCSLGEDRADRCLHRAKEWNCSDSPFGAHLQRNSTSTQPSQNESPLSGEQQHRHQLPQNQGYLPVHANTKWCPLSLYLLPSHCVTLQSILSLNSQNFRHLNLEGKKSASNCQPMWRKSFSKDYGILAGINFQDN